LSSAADAEFGITKDMRTVAAAAARVRISRAVKFMSISPSSRENYWEKYHRAMMGAWSEKGVSGMHGNGNSVSPKAWTVRKRTWRAREAA
jgi:hypothetical protein